MDDTPYAFFANVGDSLEACSVSGTVIGTRFRKLDENELAVAAVLFVEIDDGMGGGAGAGEEVQYYGILI